MPSQGSPLTAAEARPPAWWEELGAVLPRSVASVRRAARGGRTDVPALAANPLAWGSVAVDELAMSAAYLLSRRAAAEVAEPARADAAEAVAGLRAAGVIDDPTLAHPAPTDVSAVRRTTRRRVGIDFEHVSFDSGYAPPVPLPGDERWAADNDFAHAYLLRRDTAPRPWVLVLHGHRMGEPRDLRLLGSRRLQSDLDVNVAHLVLPMHGPRGRGSGGGFPGVDPVANFRGMAQAVWDARLLLSWLRGQGATSVGVFGVSLGGHVAAMLAGLEPALDAVVAGVPTCDFATMLADTMRAHWGEAALAASHVGDEDFRSLSRLVSPLAFPPRLPRDRLFVYGAVGDRLITPQQAEALWRHWDRPAILWLQGGHIVNNTGASRRFVVDAFAGCGVAGMRRGRG